MKKQKTFACLGGGIGTVQLIRGLRPHSHNITVVVSMADDGGSAGRLRRLYSVPPPGDLINCVAALSDAEPTLKQLLTYRFEGDRWGREDSIGGHKIGNLMLVALTKIMGDFYLALQEMEKMFSCHGKILPSTYEDVSIWAETITGEKVIGEETIDLGKYSDKLFKVHLDPQDVKTPKEVIEAILHSDVVVVGPGDLYTTLLPVLLVPDIIKALSKTSAKKIFVFNIANKKETAQYTLVDHMDALVRHCPSLKFDSLIANSNHSPNIKKHRNYEYVPLSPQPDKKYGTMKAFDIVDEDFAVVHDPSKLASVITSI